MKIYPLIVTLIAIIAIALILIMLFSSLDTEVKEDDLNIPLSEMIIKSVFSNNARIPLLYSCDGSDINPPLEFSGIPKGAKSLVLIMDDPDSPSGTWDHWILYNIPPQTSRIEQDSLPQGSLQGKNSWGENGYGGPCPGKGTHHYFFRLFALDSSLGLKQGVTKQELEKAMQNHILAKAELIGLYSRS